MASQTTNLGLTLPIGSENVSRQIINNNNTIIDGAVEDNSELVAIVVNGDTAPKAITSGQYLFIKNHTTLATGAYHATANIANGAAVTSSNVAQDADGIANALNGNITNISNVDLTNQVKSVFTTITDVDACLRKIGKMCVISVQFKAPSAVSSGSVSLTGIPSTGKQLYSALASIGGNGGFISLSGTTLYIRCDASGGNFMCGELTYFG